MLRIFGHFVPAATVTLGFVEAAIIMVALYIGVAFFGTIEPTVHPAAAFLLLVTACAVAVMHSGGLYRAEALIDVRETLRRGLPILTLVLVVVSMLISMMTAPQFVAIRDHWSLIFLIPLIWLASILITRTVFARISRTGALHRRVLILGQGPRSVRLLRLRCSNPVAVLAWPGPCCQSC